MKKQLWIRCTAWTLLCLMLAALLTSCGDPQSATGTRAVLTADMPFQRVVLMDGKGTMHVNNIPQEIDDNGSVPMVKDGCMLAPYSAAVIALEAGVVWKVKKDTVKASYQGMTAELTVGQATMLLDGTEVPLETPPEKVNGAIYLPLKPLAESLHCGAIGWHPASGTLIATTGEAVSPEKIAYSQILLQPESWYGSAESIRLADNIMLFQRNGGGWVKNTDFAAELSQAQQDAIAAQKNANDATFDNEATIPEIRYLLKMYDAAKIESYKEAYRKGLNAVLDCQYDNGGWPQYLQDTSSIRHQIAFNDNAMVNIMIFLTDIAQRPKHYPSLDAKTVERCQAAIDKGLACILKLQIYSEEQQMLTAWCGQYDEVSLLPVKARNYEPASISGWESVGIITYLMDIENPSEAVQKAIHAAVAWFAHVEIFGYRHERIDGNMVLTADANARGLWARFYDIATFKPLFWDRDGKDKLAYDQLSSERRNGYWYMGSWGQSLPDAYAAWKGKNGIA